MRIGHEVTAEEREALAKRLGRALRIGERLTAADAERLRTDAPRKADARVVPRRRKRTDNPDAAPRRHDDEGDA